MNNQYPYSLILLLFFITILITNPIKAQRVDPLPDQVIYDSVAPKNDLLEFPMKDLTNMKVTVASKKEEKVSDAPSSISVYSSKEIENLGYYTLADLASVTSGYNVNYQYGETGLTTRGLAAGGFENNKHLLMIDGIPVNFARSYKAQTQEELPLFFAKRVEFLKGPASALYGVSAFNGVISVISKDLPSNGTYAESKFSAGNLNKNIRLMSNISHRSNAGISTINIGYYRKNSSADYIYDVNNNPISEDYRYWDRNNSLFFKASHQFTSGKLNGLTLGTIYMSRTGSLGESWLGANVSSQINRITWTTLVPYLKYHRQLGKKLALNSYLKGNNSIEEAEYRYPQTGPNLNSSLPQNGLSFYQSNVLDWEALSELNYELNTRNRFIIGFNYDQRFEQGNPDSYSYHVDYPDTLSKTNSFAYTKFKDFRDKSSAFRTVSGYFQMQKCIPFLSGLTITGGVRYDLGTIKTYQYQRLSPRIAVVQKITPELNLKLMTGQALRAPNLKEQVVTEQFLNEVRDKRPDTIITISEVKEEIIQTYEAGIYYNTPTISISASVFYNVNKSSIVNYSIYVKDAQGKDTISSATLIRNYSGNINSKGFEIDFVGILSTQFNVFSNYTYSLAQYSPNTYFAGVPYSQLNGGLTYSMAGKYKLRSSLVVKYVNGYLLGGSTKKTNGSFAIIDLNTLFPLNENLQMELQVRNLLGQKIHVAPLSTDPGDPANYLIPLPGRSFLLTLSVNFK